MTKITRILPNDEYESVTGADSPSASNPLLTTSVLGDPSIVNVTNSYRRGFERQNPDTMPEIAYNIATSTFTASVKTGQTSFHFWANGTKFVKTTTQSIVWPDMNVTWYFYFNTSGTLAVIKRSDWTQALFTTVAICGMLTWNPTDGVSIVKNLDEMHGVGYESNSHFIRHLDIGAVWYQGGDITGLADGSDDYTSVATIVMADEDITHILTTSTLHPFIYRFGTDGNDYWKETATPNNKVAHMVGGTAQYNKLDAGTWGLANIAGYGIVVMIWTPDADEPIKKALGSEIYANRNAARTALFKRLQVMALAGLPGAETKMLFGWIIKANGDLEDNGSGGDVMIDVRGKRDKALTD